MSFPDQNTIERFEQAKEAGVDIVETDLRASRDGEVFLFHDKRMENLTNCVGPIADKTAGEISRCKLRGTTLGLSTFRDLLAWSEGRVVINAELKNADSIEPAFRLVREYDAFRWVYFQVNGNYEKARAADPRVALLVAPKGPKAQEVLNHYLSLGDPNLMIVELRPGLNTPGNIGAIHAAGKLVSEDSWYFGRERLWGGRHARCDKVFQHGIDIAISDIPAGCVLQRDEADLLLLR
jgi:glycerophosphoryl diester phosphodiesterase